MAENSDHDQYRAHLKRQGFELDGKPLGSGLSGTVWRAQQSSLGNRPVAVKFGDTMEAKRNPAVLQRFKREAILLTKCQHPRIPYILTRGTVEDPEIPYIVMEFIEGEKLASYREREGLLKPQEALEMMLPVIDALSHVHRHDVIHRDVTLHNIMISPDHGPMLIDFSIGSDGRHRKEGPTKTGETLGTHYAAPEQLEDASNIDASTDVYSVALVLYELITGQLKTDRDSAQRFEIPDELFRVLNFATGSVPFLRPTNCTELFNELSPFLQSSTSIWQAEVSLAVCQNVECWEWNNWNEGAWIPTYQEDTQARYCSDCGEPLLRYCSGCRSEITKQNCCGNCGTRFLEYPKCNACEAELDWRDWNDSRGEDKQQCRSCRNSNTGWDDDDIPF